MSAVFQYIGAILEPFGAEWSRSGTVQSSLELSRGKGEGEGIKQ